MNIPKEVKLENVKCPLGCSESDEVIINGRDILHGLSGEFTAVKCCDCGLIRTNPRPTPDTIGYYYPDNYGPYLDTVVQQTRSKKYQNIKNIIKKIFNRNTECLPPLIVGRLLEIGCASGAFLHQMAEKGWQVQGIEFSEKAAQAAAQLGYQVYAGALENAPNPDAPIDLIVGWMVLEHLHDPVGGLKKLREWIKSDGWLALSIPNAQSLEFSVFKDKWYALQLPTHLHHFTPTTLEKVLVASGWELEKIHHQRVIKNIIASIGYVLQDKGFIKLGQKFIDVPSWIQYFLFPLAWLLSLFGQTGRMTIWARPLI